MPVSTNQQREALRVFGKIATSDRIVIEDRARIYDMMKSLTPKGFRGSLLKGIDWPTSWAVLYDLSPAQISQNRERVVAEDVLRRQSFDSNLPNSEMKRRMWRNLLKSYFAGNAYPISQSDFPRWRKPSWMTQGEADQIKELISAAYEGRLLGAYDEGEQTQAETPSEAEMAQPMPAEETRNQPLPTVDATESDGRRILKNIYTRHRGSFIREFEVGRDNGNITITNVDTFENFLTALGEVPFYTEYTKVVYILERIFNPDGTRPQSVRYFLGELKQRGWTPTAIETAGGSQSSPYLRMTAFGTRSANAFRNNKAFYITGLLGSAGERFIKEQFTSDGGIESRIVTSSSLRSLGKVLTLLISTKYVYGRPVAETDTREQQVAAQERANSQLDRLRTQADLILNEAVGSAAPTQADERQEATAQAASELASEGVLQSGSGGQGDTPVETQVDSPPNYYYLGYAKFPARRAFSTLSPFFYEADGIYRVDGDIHSFAFYFVRPDGGRYDIYRSIFSPMSVNEVGILNELKEAWASSGQLDSPNSIKLKKAGPQEAQRVREAFLEVTSRVNEPSTIQIKPERIATDAIPVPFNKIGGPLRILQQLVNQFEESRAQSTSSTSSSMILTKEQMIDSARVKFENHTFGWELEAYVKESNRSRAADVLNRVAPEGALKFKSSTPDTMPVNGGRYGLVNDTSINYPNSQRGETNRKDEGYENYTVAEFVSPVLEGAKGLDLVKKCCEAMNSAGVRVNASDGLHVHFDGHGRGTSPTLKAWQMSNMVINYHVLWPVIDRIQNIGRTGRNNGWAKDWPPAKIEEFMRFSDSKSNDYKKLYRDIYQGHPIRTWAIGAGPKYHNSRYRAVNLHGTVTQAGTIEFRQGSPTTDYLYIQNWILFLYHLIEVSKKGYFKKPSSDVDSTSYLRDVWTYCELMLPDDVASFIANETYIIDGESVENNQPSNRTRR